MKKGLKFLIVLICILSISGHVVGLGALYQLQSSAQALAKRGLHHWISVSAQVGKLEDALAVFWSKDTEASDETTTTATESQTSPETSPEETAKTDMETEAISEATPSLDTSSDTEILTEATTRSPMRYTIKAHEGIIGVFDDNGLLTETLNVAIITLPEQDREALIAGISVYGMEEVRKILDKLV